jgi:hypothetical protein
MNRLKDFFNDPQEPESQDDFYVVEKRYGSFAVSRQTAVEIERVLDQSPPPRWVVFRDLNGSRHRVLVEHISRISESTAEQRAADRAFDRARRLEDKRDRRPWEDDD